MADKTPVGIEERNTIRRIMERQDQIKQMNAEQRIHHDKVRSGEISPMQALMSPMTPQRIQVQGQADKIFMSAEDRKLRDSYEDEEYKTAMRETIVAERIESQRHSTEYFESTRIKPSRICASREPTESHK